MTVCRWCSNGLLSAGEVARGSCAVCRPMATEADEIRLPSRPLHAEPVEGPRGDPENGGSPPAGHEPPDPRAPTVPAPPPTLDMSQDDG
jgi:hypothetical protein